MNEELSLSEVLRRAREERGESLEQVHQRTGIALKILQGLETGDFEIVEPVYARLAIYHYASHLGLDGEAVETRLREEVAATRPPLVETHTTPVSATHSSEPSPLAELIRSQPPARLATVGVVLVVGLAILLYLLGSDAPTPNPSGRLTTPAPRQPAASAPRRQITTAIVARVDEEPAAGEPIASADEEPLSNAAVFSVDEGSVGGQEPVQQDVASDSNSVDAEPTAVTPDNAADLLATGLLVLHVDALDSTWVQVQWDDTDGDVETIPSGEQRTWTAQQFFMVRAGRAHGVHFRFQGELLGAGRLGDPTKVLRFHASADGVQLLGPDLEPIAPIAPVAQVLPDTTEASGQDRP
ncbi:MAG TPA: hypothetical protein DIC52_25150 [Candidatus Latescibacteria bacterium]|nr:hypothetical protein [Candidatus Latescibacterota bacterium]